MVSQTSSSGISDSVISKMLKQVEDSVKAGKMEKAEELFFSWFEGESKRQHQEPPIPEPQEANGDDLVEGDVPKATRIPYSKVSRFLMAVVLLSNLL